MTRTTTNENEQCNEYEYLNPIFSGAPKCEPESQDLLFLMDGSATIGSKYFRQAQKFLKRLIGKMTVGRNATHVGVMQYGSTGRVIHTSTLSEKSIRSQISDDISRMVYMNERRDSDLAYAFSVASDTVSLIL